MVGQTRAFVGPLKQPFDVMVIFHRSNIAQRDDFPKIVLKESRSLPIPLVTAKNAKAAKELSIEVKQMLASQESLQILRVNVTPKS